jgi:hypothetical protein
MLLKTKLKTDSFQVYWKNKGFAVLLLVLVGFLGYLLSSRGEMEAKFIKPAGSTFFNRWKVPTLIIHLLKQNK